MHFDIQQSAWCTYNMVAVSAADRMASLLPMCSSFFSEILAIDQSLTFSPLHFGCCPFTHCAGRHIRDFTGLL